MRRALISVSDKTGMIDFAKALAGHGIELLSTGGSAQQMRDEGLDVKDVAEVTGFPEMMDGRVKTLHPVVHGGLLARRDDDGHLAAMTEHGIGEIDLLVVNLYPFEETVAKGADFDTCIENIDIGGPAMIRSAAKNHAFVNVVTDVQDYAAVLMSFQQTVARQRSLCVSALRKQPMHEPLPMTLLFLLGWRAQSTLKHRAGLLRARWNKRFAMAKTHIKVPAHTDGSGRPGVATATQHQGKELSYNNINDTDAAFELVAEFDPADGPACAIIKHANPCGVARGATLLEAYKAAFDCDRTSAFGGIVAFNQELDEVTAQEMAGIFTEVVIAPAASDAAKAVFAAKKNLRLLTTDGLPNVREGGLTYRQVAGGMLVQDKDVGFIGMDDLKVVTKVAPTDAQMDDLLFAWKVAKHVKSNAIVYVKDKATVGVGAGQMSRVDSALIAAKKAERMAETIGLAEPLTKGSAVASDAFFPFADGLLEAVAAGATCVIQPGGSMRDDEVIAAADEAGIAMVFTGMRHFRH